MKNTLCCWKLLQLKRESNKTRVSRFLYFDSFCFWKYVPESSERVLICCFNNTAWVPGLPTLEAFLANVWQAIHKASRYRLGCRLRPCGMNKATLLSGNTRPGTRALASSSSKHNTPASFEFSSTFRTCFLTHRRDEHQTRMEKTWCSYIISGYYGRHSISRLCHCEGHDQCW
jgi:hypothetical protein